MSSIDEEVIEQQEDELRETIVQLLMDGDPTELEEMIRFGFEGLECMDYDALMAYLDDLTEQVDQRAPVPPANLWDGSATIFENVEDTMDVRRAAEPSLLDKIAKFEEAPLPICPRSRPR